MIKSLKVFLNWSTDKDLNKTLIFKKFKAFKEESEAVSLTEDELMKLFYFSKLTPCFKVVRDLFCFSCFTGLRFSDIYSFKETSIKDDYIEVKTQKTRQFIRIPLNRYAKEIWLEMVECYPNLYQIKK